MYSFLYLQINTALAVFPFTKRTDSSPPLELKPMATFGNHKFDVKIVILFACSLIFAFTAAVIAILLSRWWLIFSLRLDHRMARWRPIKVFSGDQKPNPNIARVVPVGYFWWIVRRYAPTGHATKRNCGGEERALFRRRMWAHSLRMLFDCYFLVHEVMLLLTQLQIYQRAKQRFWR